MDGAAAEVRLPGFPSHAVGADADFAGLIALADALRKENGFGRMSFVVLANRRRDDVQIVVGLDPVVVEPRLVVEVVRRGIASSARPSGMRAKGCSVWVVIGDESAELPPRLGIRIRVERPAAVPATFDVIRIAVLVVEILVELSRE